MLRTATILAFGLTLSSFAFEAQAFPIAPAQATAPEVLQVRGLCGLGFHRGPYGGCVRNGVGYVEPVIVAPGYVAPVVVAPVVVAPRACPFGYGYAPAYGRCVPL